MPRRHLPQRVQHLPMNVFAGGNNAAGLDHVIASVEVGDETAGFAHQRDPRRHVPQREATLPIRIKAAGRDPQRTSSKIIRAEAFQLMGDSCEKEVQLRLITELRGLYREAFPASRHVI
jgi:hypothetical protein